MEEQLRGVGVASASEALVKHQHWHQRHSCSTNTGIRGTSAAPTVASEALVRHRHQRHSCTPVPASESLVQHQHWHQRHSCSTSTGIRGTRAARDYPHHGKCAWCYQHRFLQLNINLDHCPLSWVITSFSLALQHQAIANQNTRQKRCLGVKSNEHLGRENVFNIINYEYMFH